MNLFFSEKKYWSEELVEGREIFFNLCVYTFTASSFYDKYVSLATDRLTMYVKTNNFNFEYTLFTV